MDRTKWGGPSKESLKQAYENRGKYEKNSTFVDIYTEVGQKLVWKPENKAHKVRLLPSLPSDGVMAYGMTIHQHLQVGANNDKYLCLKRMSRLNCPICEEQAEIWDADPELAKSLYPQMRYLVWMVDLDQPKDKQKVQLWNCPKGVMDDILGVSYKRSNDEVLNIAHPDTGYVLFFDKEAVDKTTFAKYKNFQLDDEPTSVKDELLEQIISYQDIIKLESYETVKSAFFGTGTTLNETENADKEEQAEQTVEPKNDGVDKDESAVEKPIDDDGMDRDQLEILANEVLVDDYEVSEIADMGTKKLKRLVKEAIEKKSTSKDAVEKPYQPEPEDPREALKRKLRERVK